MRKRRTFYGRRSIDIPQGGRPAPEITRQLLAHSEFFSGEATWRRAGNIWTCVAATESLAWMRRTPFAQIKNELLKRGYSWEWLPAQPILSAANVGEAEPGTVEPGEPRVREDKVIQRVLAPRG